MTAGDSRAPQAPAQGSPAHRPPPPPVSRILVLVLAALGATALATLLDATEDLYASIQSGNGVASFDQPILEAMIAHRTPALNTIVGGFTQLGGPIGMPILAGLLVLVLSLRWRSWAPLALIAVAAAGSLTITSVGKRLSDRERPPLIDRVAPFEHSPSFPSGHTLNTTVIALVTVYLVFVFAKHPRTKVVWVLAATLFTVAIGLSRIYLGQHWTTDVLAGWVAGAAWALIVIGCDRLLVLLLDRHARHAWASTRERPAPPVP